MTDKKFCEIIFPKVKTAQTLMDIGCGEGYLCNCLAQKLKKPVVGLDIKSHGFTKAHKLCKKFQTCRLIKCIQGKAENLQKVFPRKKFDAVTFVHSFHHLHNARLVLQQIKNVLKKDGLLLIAEYSPWRGKKEDKCKRFTIKFIMDLLMKTDFSPITIEKLEEGFFLFTAKA